MRKPERPSPTPCPAHILCWNPELSATLLMEELGVSHAKKRTFSAICGYHLVRLVVIGAGGNGVLSGSLFVLTPSVRYVPTSQGSSIFLPSQIQLIFPPTDSPRLSCLAPFSYRAMWVLSESYTPAGTCRGGGWQEPSVALGAHSTGCV